MITRANSGFSCHTLFDVLLRVLPGQNCSSLWIIKMYWKVLFSFWEPIWYKKRKRFFSSCSVKAKTEPTPGQVVPPHYLLISSATSLPLEEQLRLLCDTEVRINLCDWFSDKLIVRSYFPLDAREDLVSLYCPSLSSAVLIHCFFSTCCNTAEHGHVLQQCPRNLEFY